MWPPFLFQKTYQRPKHPRGLPLIIRYQGPQIKGDQASVLSSQYSLIPKHPFTQEVLAQIPDRVVQSLLGIASVEPKYFRSFS